MFAMSGDGKEVDDVTIPVVFLFFMEAAELMKAINAADGDLTVTLGNKIHLNLNKFKICKGLSFSNAVI